MDWSAKSTAIAECWNPRGGITTHSTRAELACLSFASSDAWLDASRRVNSSVRLLMVMETSKPKLPFIVMAIYLLAVLACIFLAFDFAGAINTNWTLVLIALTLPWSIVSIIFAWALIHGAGLEFFTLMYLLFAGLNSLIFYKLYWLFRRRAKNEQS